jgi:CPA2 family monovalent cation:H+ antiporter-2
MATPDYDLQMHDITLITTIAAAFTSAWVLGLITQWLRLSPIVGYLLAGILIGPHTPGFVGDIHIAQQLAEIGVILLMFGVGLHFHLSDLLAVKWVAIPGALGQSLIATITCMMVFAGFGFSWDSGIVIGMAMAVASTVVLMRVLIDADMLNSPQGHVAVGWLIVEDILTVILLVLIPAFGRPVGEAAVANTETAAPFWLVIGIAFIKLGVLIAIVFFGGSRVVPWVMVRVARLRSRELFTLTVLVCSIAIATGSYYFFGASMALGAFLAGMVVAQSPVSHQAAADALPMRDAFAVLFFVSVGMLFDPMILIEQPLMILSALGIVLLIKPLAALLIVAMLGHSGRIALTVAVGLAQIGEFSFILSDLAREHGLMPDVGHNLLVATAIISITLNPLLFRALPSIESWLKSRTSLWKWLNAGIEKRVSDSNRDVASELRQSDPSQENGLAIVVGYGPVGRSVHRLLQDAGLSTVIIDMNMDTINALNANGQPAIFGDASHEMILEQAGICRATHLVLTLPHTSERAAVVAAARYLNPQVRILVRARYISEREGLEQAGANIAIFEEVEAAVALARRVLSDTGLHREAADRKIKDLRLQLITENISNIRSQRVRSVMVPWARVRWLPNTLTRAQVIEQLARERFSRWPVIEMSSGRIQGYLLTKDLFVHNSDSDWSKDIRPLQSIEPDESIESILIRMQDQATSIYAVESDNRPVGLVTFEDILEQVVGQIEDEYPHTHGQSLLDAVERGAYLSELQSFNANDVIREMAQAIRSDALPSGIQRDEIMHAIRAREIEVSTDLGNGVAIPHARCQGITESIVVLARSLQGFLFSPVSTQPVHLVFLLITPSEKPETQLELLRQIVSICREPADQERILDASSLEELRTILRALSQDRL